MQVEIITIGDELLIGQVIDTNSAWMGQKLNEAGFRVNRITSIGDSESDILDILKETTRRSPIVLLTGGLGPTRDDITKEALCKFFKTKLVFNHIVFGDIETFLKGRLKNINELNRKQAMVPENCTVIRNSVGTAPILCFNHSGVLVISMPGVPSEMKNAMDKNIIPLLRDKYSPGVIIHKTVHILNIPEAVLAEMLTKWENQIPDFIKVAYLPSPGKLRLRLTGTGHDATLINNTINCKVNELYPIIGNNIYGFDDEKYDEALLKLLFNHDLTLSCAESCSGGFICHRLTSIPGASKIFKGGVIAYSDDVKINDLGVKKDSIVKFGAVSRQVVEEMVSGICTKFKTDYSIATSGIAGPTGGSDEKPVGTVWIAWAGKGKVISRKFQFGPNRETTIIRSSETAIIMLKKFIEEKEL